MKALERRPLHFAVLVALISTGAPAKAQGPEPEGVRWSLGLGVISSPRPYVGADNQLRVIPVLDFAHKRFYFRGIGAGFEMIKSERFNLDIVGRAQFAGYDEDDSSFLAGMEARRETLELGLKSEWKLGDFDIEATIFSDALRRSDGTQARLELTWAKVFGRGKGGVFPGISVIWQDAAFVDYYAGVEPEEARPDRPAFEGGSALNFGFGVRAFFKMTERVRMVGLVRAERLAGEYGDSPIVDSRWGHFGLAAIAYEF